MCRPESVIDWDKVDQMLVDGYNGTEVASTLGIHPETFYDRAVAKHGIAFSEYKAKKQAVGDGQLRTAQMKKALKGDNTMLIWLGKNRLGQKENNSNLVVPEDVANAFNNLMQQIQAAQDARKMAEIINISETKSVCDTGDSAASNGKSSIF
jgi:hypothetical protein